MAGSPTQTVEELTALLAQVDCALALVPPHGSSAGRYLRAARERVIARLDIAKRRALH